MNTEKIVPLEKKVWLSSPTMHGEELRYMTEAYETNWMSTVGANITEMERITCEKTGSPYAVALASGTAALHMAVRLAAHRIYGTPEAGRGALAGKKVFCSDVTFGASVNPVLYEGGEPIFLDAEEESWNMDPEALKRAFERYPDVRIIIVVHLYGTMAKMEEIREIASEYHALIIEDAAEALGASYHGKQAGTWGDYGILSFNGNKIITGSSGGSLLVPDREEAEKAAKWSTQAREKAAWYQHEELGYNYRISNVTAGVVRGQYAYLEEHIERKKEIYERYREGFKDLPVCMNPVPDGCTPNYWLSCIMIDGSAMAQQNRGKTEVVYRKEAGKTCPSEILETLEALHAEGRPIWKPMHLQPVYRKAEVVTAEGLRRRNPLSGMEDSFISTGERLFERGLCLPSDIKMTEEEQERIISVVRGCFA